MDEISVDHLQVAIDAPVPPGCEAGFERSRLSRRGFLNLSLGALLAGLGLEVLAVIAGYLSPKPDKVHSGGIVEAGVLRDFPPGSVREFPEAGFFIIRTGEGGFMAVYRRCTHLGCTVRWDDASATFLCPCHAAHFDAYGDFSRPPVPRALDLFPIEFREDAVLVDTSRPIPREHFSPDQLVFPPGEATAMRRST